MHNSRYVFAIIGLTVVTLIVGIVLWTSEEPQKLSPDPGGGDEIWSLGPQDAPVVIKTFPDFT